MAKIKKSSSNIGGTSEKRATVYDNKGNRKASVSKRKNENGKTRYGVSVDNVGSPYRSASENEINTPVGTLDYGYDGDTVYAGVTPNAYRTSWSAPMGDGRGTVSQDYGTLEVGNDAMLRGGRYGNTVDGNTYFASAFLPGDQQYVPNYEGSVNTPVGRVGLETNYDEPNTIEANYTPNQYIQALINLLRRR